MTIKFYTLFLLFIPTVFADLKSNTGQIKFITQLDQQAEMVLNSTGLGIGVTPSTNLHVNGNAIISKQLFIGGGSGSANLNVNGTISHGYETVTGSTTLSRHSMVLADTSSGNLVLSLPDASTMEGRTYTIKKTNTLNSLFIRDGGYLDQSSDITLSVNQMGCLSVISHSGNWHILTLDGSDDAISSDNLVAWWKLDEATGVTTVDSSLHSNHGTLTNGFTFSDNSIDGRLNSALDFDGLDDYITIPDSSSLDNFTNQITISFWVKDEDQGSSRGYISKEYNSSTAWGFEDGRFFMWTDNTNLDHSFDDIDDDSWHFMATTWNGTNSIIYRDGTILSNSVTGTGNMKLGNDPLTIGLTKITGGGIRYLQGNIDDIRIYNRVLIPTEIKTLYNQGQ